MRGGGPRATTSTTAVNASSPHARGWSRSASSLIEISSVFPACAGVVPDEGQRLRRPRRLPRMRGGGPCRMSGFRSPSGSSPHARGWSVSQCDLAYLRVVFPACAGVVPLSVARCRAWSSLPRMRGGGPELGDSIISVPESSPHARGWSHHKPAAGQKVSVFPACAGVVPPSVVSCSC